MALCRNDLASIARDEGFLLDRIAPLGPTPHADTLERWLDDGYHADMTWMERTRDLRVDPRARDFSHGSVWMLGVPHVATLPPDPGGFTGQVARYAWGRDYHNALKKPIRRIKRRLAEHGIDAWGGVDSEPIVERAWATAAGLGFTGKSCIQIVPRLGTYWRLVALVLNTPYPSDPPVHRDLCGTCTRCLVACPTKAFDGERRLDARKCISYWTIESRELAPRNLRPAFGRWLVGCDVCQEVCPHNHIDRGLVDGDSSNAWIDLASVITATDAQLLDRFEGTALRRPGASGLKRNALIALGNIGDTGALSLCEHAMHHNDGVVRGAAVWAMARLGHIGPGATDTDPRVREEASAAPHVMQDVLG